MAVLLTGWVLIGIGLPCFLGFVASYYKKGRMMLVLLGLLVPYSVVMIAGIYNTMPDGVPATNEQKVWGAVYAMLLMFGAGGAGFGLLVGGGAGWILRGRL